MKKQFIALLALMGAGLMASAQTEVVSKIEKVTVYPNGALVEKSFTANLQKGENKFVVSGNSYDVNASMVHFEVSPHWVLGSMKVNDHRYGKDDVVARQMPQAAFQQYRQLCDQIADSELKLSNLKTLEQILNTQAVAIRQMRAVTNPGSFVNVDSLRSQLEYQRSELQKINTSLAKSKTEKTALEDKLRDDKMAREKLLRKYLGGSVVNNSTKDVVVTIYSDRNENNAKINYSYKITGNSICNYSYDVYLDEDTKRAIFVLKAEVSQSTAENWVDCPLVFSTIDANNAGFDAVLDPYYLDFYAPAPQYRANRALAKSMRANALVQYEDAVVTELTVVDEEMGLPSAMMENLTLAREYALATKQTVSADYEKQTFMLHRDTTMALFSRFATPKNEEKVHFTALLPKWEDLGLMDLGCNVYMGSRFVSTSQVMTSGVGDTMRFAVGEDRNVKVQRQVRRTSPSSNGLLGKETEIGITVTITLKNTKAEDVEVSLKDQVPLSANTEIKVTPNVGEGTMDELTGVVRWKVALKPMEQKTITFGYTVRCPKDKASMLELL